MSPKGYVTIAIAAVIGVMGLALLILFLFTDKSQLEGRQIVLSIVASLTCLAVACVMVASSFDDVMKGGQ